MIAFKSLPFALAQAGATMVEVDRLPDWLELVTSIATVIIALALVVAALALMGVALALRKLVGRARGMIDQVQQGVKPLLGHAEEIAGNVNYVSSSIRDDVEHFKGTIRTSQERLDRAAAAAEQRINELNALIGVVQEEAERIFIDTASTLRGVRVGAITLQRSREAEWEGEVEEAPASARTRTHRP